MAFKEAGGLGGTHGDDIFCTVSMAGLKKAGGGVERKPPALANKMIHMAMT